MDHNYYINIIPIHYNARRMFLLGFECVVRHMCPIIFARLHHNLLRCFSKVRTHSIMLILCSFFDLISLFLSGCVCNDWKQTVWPAYDAVLLNVTVSELTRQFMNQGIFVPVKPATAELLECLIVLFENATIREHVPLSIASLLIKYAVVKCLIRHDSKSACDQNKPDLLILIVNNYHSSLGSFLKVVSYVHQGCRPTFFFFQFYLLTSPLPSNYHCTL